MTLDTVLYNANVLVGDQAATRGRSLGLYRGKVVAVSRDDDFEAPVRIDMQGRTVVPGFHDAHCHTSWYGTSLSGLALTGPNVREVRDVYDLVAQRAASLPHGRWIIGSGIHPLRLGGQLPQRRELDRIAPHHPVWLIASSGHASVVNSAVLAMLDLSHLGTRSPLALDEFGEPTGLLEEDAHACVLEQANPYSVEDVVNGIGLAHKEYLQAGITSVQEAGVGAGLVGHGGREAAAYQQARDLHLLQVRTTLMPAAQSLHDVIQSPAEPTGFGLDLGLRSGFGDDWLRLGPVKFFTDGSVLAGTAALHGCPPGPSHYDMDWIRRRMIDAHASGWQLAVHAQGDEAVDFVLDTVQEAQQRHPRPDPRHRIEHCSVTTSEALDRMAALGVIPSTQGRFVGVVGDGILERFDDKRLQDVYRGRSFLDKGLVLAASSDRPCTEGTPLLGIHDMVNRRSDSGRPVNLAEAISPQEALRAYTYGSAYAAFLEDRLGTLQPGMLADLAVLDADPTTVAADQIRTIEVLGTMVDGEFVYDRDEALGTAASTPRQEDANRLNVALGQPKATPSLFTTSSRAEGTHPDKR